MKYSQTSMPYVAWYIWNAGLTRRAFHPLPRGRHKFVPVWLLMGWYIQVEASAGMRADWYAPFNFNLVNLFVESSLNPWIEIQNLVSRQPCTSYTCTFCSFSSLTGVHLLDLAVITTGLWGFVALIDNGGQTFPPPNDALAILFTLKTSVCACKTGPGNCMECVDTPSTLTYSNGLSRLISEGGHIPRDRYETYVSYFCQELNISSHQCWRSTR